MVRLKELRQRAGLNMREAAVSLDLPYTTYVNYEKGVREPSVDMLIRIAQFYGVSVDCLVGLADFPPEASNDASDGAPEETPVPEPPRPITPEELKLALWGDAALITEEDLEDVLRYASFLAEMKRRWS